MKTKKAERTAASNPRYLPKQVLAGHGEAIFSHLPADLIANLRTPRSENALIWNLIYPLARPGLSFQRLCSILPLFGTPQKAESEDVLVPYFWGWSLEGEKLSRLDQALEMVDGGPGHTEADLILLGRANLLLIEAKRFSGFGRCGRYLAERCPEVHRTEVQVPGWDPMAVESTCRYWRQAGARFDRWLDFGPRPDPTTLAPPCSRHYQLARLLLLGEALGELLHREFHLWLLAPRHKWPELEPDWRDFVDRMRWEANWRRSRVVAWEDVGELAR